MLKLNIFISIALIFSKNTAHSQELLLKVRCDNITGKSVDSDNY